MVDHMQEKEASRIEQPTFFGRCSGEVVQDVADQLPW